MSKSKIQTETPEALDFDELLNSPVKHPPLGTKTLDIKGRES